MGFLPKHGLYLSGRGRYASGIRNPFGHALAAEAVAFVLESFAPKNGLSETSELNLPKT